MRCDNVPPEPTLAAARARIAAVRPEAYARSRNALDGAVTGLSPYLTHGLVTLPQVLAGVTAQRPLPVSHKLIFELGWREYFRHVWAQRGDGILQSLHAGPLPESAYRRELPAEVRAGRTGLPVVDRAVQTLYACGHLHNHARMWLASALVHLYRVHWRTGADWLCAHLLDGDLASNHLSWQWVAGTGSHKPYLFNADNVARYAPPDWHSPGSPIDCGYDELDRRARDAACPALPFIPVPPVIPAQAGIQAGSGGDLFDPLAEPPLLTEPPADLGLTAPDPAALAGRDVWLVHPWSLGEPPADRSADALVLGVFVSDFHRAWPWAERRWRFVGRRMAELAPLRWWGSAAELAQALSGARRVQAQDDPHLAPWLSRMAQLRPAPRLFPPVDRRCDSFSQWWTRATRGLVSSTDLLARCNGDPPAPP